MSYPLPYNSIQFTASLSQSIITASETALKVGEAANTEASYSAWIKLTANPSSTAGIMGRTNTPLGPFVSAAGILGCQFNFNTHAQDAATTGINVVDGSWHHVVCSNKATGNSQVWLDGNLVVDHANGDFLLSSVTPFYIGAIHGTQYFNGFLADVRIFNVQLIASEILQLFKGFEVARGLCGRFPFREGGGTSTGDTCNGISGTLTNGPTFNPDHPILPSVYVPPAVQPPPASQTGPRTQYYGWITTWNTNAGGTAGPGTGADPQVYISHEILELITDADANVAASGWTTKAFCPAGGPSGGACELADQCELTQGVGNYTSLVNGVNCWSSSYYSNKGGGCIIPEIVPSTASSNQTFTWGGGKLLNNATICIIFAGQGLATWSLTNTATPAVGTADDIKRGVQTLIMNTSFYDGLAEYNVSKPTFQYATINTATIIPSPFQETHIQQVIKDSIAAGTVPNPAALTDTLIFMVVVNNSGVTGPKYFVNSTVGNHGQFQFTPPPPTNTLTANSPGSGQASVGPVSPSLQGDQWGVTMIYPSKTTGNFSSAWFLPTNPNSDTRHVVDSTTFTANADGSYRNTQTNVVYNIAQQNGFTEASLVLNQATLLTQGYMQDNKDWDNTEMTFYVRINAVANSSHTGPPSIVMAMPGARETNDATLLGSTGLPKSCEASDYRLYLEPVSGIIRFQKCLQYTAGITSNASDPVATSPVVGLTKWSNQFTGIKFVTYEMNDGVSVALELWMDYQGNNIWTQILRYVDVSGGNWSIPTNACGGTTNQTIPWGGPLVKFIWQNISSIDIKQASVREIDVYALNPALLVPPSVTQPTTPPTSSPGNNLPANPPPANQAPPVSVATGQLDKFGVKMLYPSINGGQSWYLSNRGLKGDSRVLGIPKNVKEYINGDGSFHLSQTSALFYVSTLAGYNYQTAGGLSLNHALCRVRQYMQSPRDWKNVEVTIFHNIDMFDPAPYLPKGKTYDLGIKCRTGSHSRVRDCQGCAYEIQSQLYPGLEKFFHRKEQWHDNHADSDRAGTAYTFASAMRRWVGQKFVAFNIVDPATGHVGGVKLEHYWNDNGDGVTWKKVNSTVDTGNWGTLGGLCGGNLDEVLIWGGPLIGFFWNDFTGVCYKWMSIREIDVTANTPQPSNPGGGPPSTSPPSGPPPQPPKTTPLIGANVYNVFKFPYNVQLDDTGGCPGLDPFAHLGETQLGPTVPGTGNIVSLGSVAGTQAFIVGQQIKNASSLLYNKCIAEVVVSLRLVGLPQDYATQPIYCTIRRGYDYTKVVDLGTITPNTLTSQFQLVSFKNPSLPNWSTTYNVNYTAGGATGTNGDIISIEYYGGDASNYVQIQYDTTSGYDGANSAIVYAYAGSSTVNTITGSDEAGSIYGTGQTGVQPTLLYNVPFTSFGFTGTTGIYIVNLGFGGTIRVGQQILSASSILQSKVIYEIDVWLQPPATPAAGSVVVYILDGSTGNAYSFGSKLVSSLLPGMNLYPFFNYSNTYTCSLAGQSFIIVEYSGGDSSTTGVICGVSMTSTGTPGDSTNSLAYVSSDAPSTTGPFKWTLLDILNVGPSPGVTVDGGICMLCWTSATPPVGGLPPSTTGMKSITIGNPLASSQPQFAFMGGLVTWGAVACGILLNDSKSALIGKVIREIDVSLAINSPPSVNQKPGGLIWAAVHKADGTIVSVSPAIDVGTLGNLYTQFKFAVSPVSQAYVGYKLQAGDRILIWFGGTLSGPLTGQTPGVGIACTLTDAYDDGHTVLTQLQATGVSGTSKWYGYTGNWTASKNDLICNIFYT